MTSSKRGVAVVWLGFDEWRRPAVFAWIVAVVSLGFGALLRSVAFVWFGSDVLVLPGGVRGFDRWQPVALCVGLPQNCDWFECSVSEDEPGVKTRRTAKLPSVGKSSNVVG